MKINKFLTKLLTAYIGVGALVSCSNEIPQVAPTSRVNLTVTATKDVFTRTSLEESEGNLNSKWDSDDKLIVAKASNGDKIGVLDLVSSTENTSRATFEGYIDYDGETSLNFIYAGNSIDAESVTSSSINISSQYGVLSDLTSADILTASAEVSVLNDEAEADLGVMSRKLAFGKFTLAFPENTEEASLKDATVTVSGNNILTSASMSWSGEMTFTPTTESSSITITDFDATQPLYLAIIPKENITPTFTVTLADGTSYNGSLGARDWTAGEYVRAANTDEATGSTTYSGVEVPLTKVGGDTPVIDDTVGPIINIDGKNYKFTRGNLWYNINTDTWGIHESQAYFTNAGGLGVGNSKGTTPEVIGLFAWGATGREDAQQPWFLKQEAWQTTYGGAYWPSTAGSSKNSTIKDLWANEHIYDWGYAYMNSGRLAGDNREYITPSQKAFSALFSSCFVQGATIKDAGLNGEDVTGLICIPDVTTLDAAKTLIRSVEGASCLSSMVNVNHNNSGNTLSYKNITLDNVEVLKDLNDALFFPAASKRNLNSGTVYNSNGNGWYWSSSTRTSTNATNLFFNGKDGGFYYYHEGTTSNSANTGRSNQMAVRLLVEVKE